MDSEKSMDESEIKEIFDKLEFSKHQEKSMAEKEKLLDDIFGDENKYKEKSRKPTSPGWICPQCGQVNAPWKEYCNCVQPIRYVPSPHYYPDWTYYPPRYYYWSDTTTSGYRLSRDNFS